MNVYPPAFRVNGDTDEFTITGLVPNTIYNVTLTPDAAGGGGAWGAYNTLPPGALVVKDLRVCNHTEFALSFSWEALDGDTADLIGTHYKVRYSKNKLFADSRMDWVEQPEKTRHELMCPRDPCHRLCYLLFNLDNPFDYTVQVSVAI